MFNISHNLNKKAKISVLFADKKFDFYQLSFFTKNQKDQIKILKEEFLKNDFVKSNLWEKSHTHQIVIFKIKEDASEFDFQKIGGSAYFELCKFQEANIFLDSSLSVSKNLINFVSNFFLGFYSKSYEFKDYKLKKNDKKIILKSVSVISSQKEKVIKSIKYAKDIYSGIEETRNLVTLPANILNPKKFADEIIKLKKVGLSVEILDEKK